MMLLNVIGFVDWRLFAPFHNANDSFWFYPCLLFALPTSQTHSQVSTAIRVNVSQI